jgi:hypothetical protein
MIRVLFSMILCGVLYACFVIFFPSEKCNGHCAGCTGACDRGRGDR